MKRLLIIPTVLLLICACDTTPSKLNLESAGNKVFPISTPVETEAEYISTTKAITDNRKKGIYYKEYLKNPTKFKGSRISVIGKIFHIEESEGQSALQVYVTGNNDNVVVYYKGTTEFYKDDFVRIYGEGGGIFEGKNAFGATITVPIINAKYLKKVKSDE